MDSPRLAFFRLRQRSLARGVLLALGALTGSLCLAGLPFAGTPHASFWQVLMALIVFLGMVDTARCLGRRWSLHHAGVLILLYSELMIMVLALFFWVYL